MAFNITDWNINPNRHWYVRISDITTGIKVELYTTKVDAQNQTNLVASGASDSYGSNLPIILTMDSSGSPTIEYFNTSLDYHLKVSGNSGDAYKIFHIKPFVDLPEINHSIYRSEDLIYAKALNEINSHTHRSIIRNFRLSHNTSLDEGTNLRINSNRCNIDVITAIIEYRIEGTVNYLVDSVSTIQYEDYKR